MTILNSDGISVALDGDIILDSVSYEPYKIKSTLITGEKMSDAKGIFKHGEPMGVKITGYIRGDTAVAKKSLMSLCVPNKKITLEDGTGYFLDIYAVSGLELSNARHLREKVQKFTINAVAPSPLWHTGEKSQLFYSCAGVSTDKNAIKIANEGDVSVGCLLKIQAVTGFDSVMVRIGDKRISYEQELSSGDLLFIDTRFGQKSVKLQLNGSSEQVSVIERVAPSADFFELSTGENRIDFNVLNGMSYITVYYTPAFLR